MTSTHESLAEEEPRVMSWRDKLQAAHERYGYLFVCLTDMDIAIDVEQNSSQAENMWANYLYRCYAERVEHSGVDVFEDPFAGQLVYRPVGYYPEDDSVDDSFYVQVDLDNIEKLLKKLPAELLDYRT